MKFIEMDRFIAHHDIYSGILSTKIPGTCNSGTPIPILLPYHSHKNPLKYGNGMGGLWEGGPIIDPFSKTLMVGVSLDTLFIPQEKQLDHVNYSWRLVSDMVLTYISCMDTAYVRENPPPK